MRVWLLLAIVGLLACSRPAPEYIGEQPDPEFPRVRYLDGRGSHNDRCPVRLNKLNRKMPPVYVNDEPVGFC